MNPISQAKIKYVQALQHKKYRNKYQTYVLEGQKACQTLIEAGHLPVFMVVTDRSPFATEDVDYDIYVCNASTMASLSDLKTAPDVLCIFDLPQPPELTEINQTNQLVLHLDRIQDPGNLGTIIRTADWFGIEILTLNKGCCDVYNRKTLQSAMGSHVNVKIIYAELDELQKHSPDRRVLGLDAGGTDLYSYTRDGINRPIVLIVGNEGQGLSDTYRKRCDELISIPGSDQRLAESLNASIATAIAIDRLVSR